MSIKLITKLAIVAAIYVTLTVALSPLSYNGIQFRIAEVLVLLCFYRKEYVYSLIVGCLVANLFSPFMIYDIIFGTLHTALSVYVISKMKNLFVASLIPSIFMPIVGFVLYYGGLPFIEAFIFPIIGELVVVTIVGNILFIILEKNQSFMKLIEANKNWEEENEI